MTAPGFCLNCEILENESFNFCIFTIDETVLNRDDQQSKAGEMLLIVDQVSPTMRKELKKVPFKIKGILIIQPSKERKSTRVSNFLRYYIDIF